MLPKIIKWPKIVMDHDSWYREFTENGQVTEISHATENRQVTEKRHDAENSE